MTKSDYQFLRFAVENHIANLVRDPVVARALCNDIMRDFVQAMGASQVKQAAAKRTFVSFRRDRQPQVPLRPFNSGIDSRLPKL